MTTETDTATHPHSRFAVAFTQAIVAALRDRAIQSSEAPEAGQTTAEYGLVLLAAATLAMLLVAWAGGTDAIGAFFDTIMDKVTSLIVAVRPVSADLFS